LSRYIFAGVLIGAACILIIGFSYYCRNRLYPFSNLYFIFFLSFYFWFRFCYNYVIWLYIQRDQKMLHIHLFHHNHNPKIMEHQTFIFLLHLSTPDKQMYPAKPLVILIFKQTINIIIW